MRCTILANLTTPRGRRATRRVRVLLAARYPEVEARWVPLARDLAGEPSGERLIVIGGDGTINTALAWLYRSDGSMPLGIIPAGTGNNLAISGLGVPRDTAVAGHIAIGGTRTRVIDAIRYDVEGEDEAPRRAGLIVQSAALGFPARVSRRFDDLRGRWWFGPFARMLGTYSYALLALLELWRLRRRERRGYQGIPARIELPEELLEEHVFGVFLNNERSVGGNFIPAPLARIDDGLMDLCWARARPGQSYLELLRRFRHGTQLELEAAVGYRQTAGPLTLRLGEPSTLMVDGDLPVRACRVLSLEVLPSRFEMIVP